MQAKALEIRDEGTFIPALAVNMNPRPPYPQNGTMSEDEFRVSVEASGAQRYLLRRVGYPCDGRPNVIVTRLSGDGKARADMSEKAKLLPCPFCGGAMQPRDALWPSEGDTDGIIHASPTDCPLPEFSVGIADEGVSVAEAWNKRAALPHLRAGDREEIEAEAQKIIDGLLRERERPFSGLDIGPIDAVVKLRDAILSFPAVQERRVPEGDLSEDAVLDAIRTCWGSQDVRDALTVTKWKDGIDIQMPSHSLMMFVSLVRALSHPPAPASEGGWIAIADKLPPLDQVVLVHYPSHTNSPVYNWGARVGDGEGWCWGVKGGYGASINLGKDASWNDIEVDDDYPVTHWKPLDPPPALLAEKSQL